MCLLHINAFVSEEYFVSGVVYIFQLNKISVT